MKNIIKKIIKIFLVELKDWLNNCDNYKEDIIISFLLIKRGKWKLTTMRH